ncbi:MAG: hypothetical protein QW478_01400 [Candidatus Micrarchaeaceae archaeon]
MDYEIEVAHDKKSLIDRFELPLYFIVGGVDDEYLNNLLQDNIYDLVKLKSITDIPNPPFCVYASRQLLKENGYCLTFELNVLQEEEWPIINLLTDSRHIKWEKPTKIQQTWIIRSLKRMKNYELAEKIRLNMLNNIYTEKLDITLKPGNLNIESLSRLYLLMNENQRNYKIVRIINDEVMFLNKNLGNALSDIALYGCTDVDIEDLQLSINLLF